MYHNRMTRGIWSRRRVFQFLAALAAIGCHGKTSPWEEFKAKVPTSLDESSTKEVLGKPARVLSSSDNQARILEYRIGDKFGEIYFCQDIPGNLRELRAEPVGRKDLEMWDSTCHKVRWNNKHPILPLPGQTR